MCYYRNDGNLRTIWVQQEVYLDSLQKFTVIMKVLENPSYHTGCCVLGSKKYSNNIIRDLIIT